ncbi:MAG: AAA family ATPase, partial [bacterium]|nr:AAA family ATPase [bacterium]
EVSVRVLAATHQELGSMVESGAFRSDLFYRLAGLVISIPPLREHPESIAVLARNFLGDAFELTPAALELLKSQPWPGNVRQLQQILRRAKLSARDGTIDRRQLKEALEPPPGMSTCQRDADLFTIAYKLAIERVTSRFKRQYLERLLLRSRGNVSRASRESGITRSHLHVLIRELDLGRWTRGASG